MMPAYQISLFLALWVALGVTRAWGRIGLSVLVLFVSQVGLILVLGELSQHVDLRPHVALVRAWGLVLPAALAWFTTRTTSRDLKPLAPAAASDHA